jgi:hypothetical protein
MGAVSRHGFDALAFAFGALFLVVGLLLLGGGEPGLSLVWMGPLAAIAVGVVVLVAAWPPRRRTDEPPNEDLEP